ncbi:hypothetical protein GCM10007862_25690 [Dyella lipolytica]|uniref:Uncharacterized protein n=1 Tax=Dyella lipolytica TaxID=1867835 RepID=A0ABW8IXG9_9GAMM|nr:hypothetical protein [Dyella lipolytica]GLQ47518.1 hypothetical protein GCM10007862_25690 [Dyella lipolytica]
MAKPDHTAHARPSVPTDRKSTSPFDGPLFPLDPVKASRQTYITKLAGTALAAHVIRELLSNSEAFHRAKANGKRIETGHWPLTPSQTNGLHAAIHFLRQYVDTLRQEPAG